MTLNRPIYTSEKKSITRSVHLFIWGWPHQMCKWAIFRTANSANQRATFFFVTPDWLDENKNVENQICNGIKTFKFLSTKLNIDLWKTHKENFTTNLNQKKPKFW